MDVEFQKTSGELVALILADAQARETNPIDSCIMRGEIQSLVLLSSLSSRLRLLSFVSVGQFSKPLGSGAHTPLSSASRSGSVSLLLPLVEFAQKVSSLHQIDTVADVVQLATWSDRNNMTHQDVQH